MSYLQKMYARSQKNTAPTSKKNPNRVLGGLRGQGVDTMTVLGEDGSEHTIPSQKYVEGLEQKLRSTEVRLNKVEQQLRRLNRD